MPIPPETKISYNADRWDDNGEYIGNEYHMIHVPCPTRHIATTAMEKVVSEFDIVEAKYDSIDGGHAVFVVPEETDPEQVADLAENERDNAREQHGLDPYEPAVKQTDPTPSSEDDENEDDDPRYIQ